LKQSQSAKDLSIKNIKINEKPELNKKNEEKNEKIDSKHDKRLETKKERGTA